MVVMLICISINAMLSWLYACINKINIILYGIINKKRLNNICNNILKYLNI